MTTPMPLQPKRLDAQAKFGAQVSAALEASSSELPQDITERLRIARLQAVERARLTRSLAAAPAAVAVHGDGSAAAGAPGSWFTTLAAWVPLLVLVLGLMAIQSWHESRRIDAAAELDAALLADDLPPTAYGDPGFVEFLKQRER